MQTVCLAHSIIVIERETGIKTRGKDREGMRKKEMGNIVIPDLVRIRQRTLGIRNGVGPFLQTDRHGLCG